MMDVLCVFFRWAMPTLRGGDLHDGCFVSCFFRWAMPTLRGGDLYDGCFVCFFRWAMPTLRGGVKRIPAKILHDCL
jgi:hypothetical protein